MEDSSNFIEDLSNFMEEQSKYVYLDCSSMSKTTKLKLLDSLLQEVSEKTPNCKIGWLVEAVTEG